MSNRENDPMGILLDSSAKPIPKDYVVTLQMQFGFNGVNPALMEAQVMRSVSIASTILGQMLNQAIQSDVVTEEMREAMLQKSENKA